MGPKVPTIKFPECILGNTPCGIKVVVLYNEGILSAGDWNKIARTYNLYAIQAKEVWESRMSFKTKRRVDDLLFADTLKCIDSLSVHILMRNHLKNIIRAHHRKLAKAYGLDRVENKKNRK